VAERLCVVSPETSTETATMTTTTLTDLALAAHLASIAKANSFPARIAVDFAVAINRYGSLTPKQRALVEKLVREIETAPAEAPKVDAPEGKLVVTGRVVTVKEKEHTHYASLDGRIYVGSLSIKCLLVVSTEAGEWKLWVTVPKAAFDAGRVERGSILTIETTVERSKDDRSFAFGKRPKFISLA
jgi:hypothetical protein